MGVNVRNILITGATGFVGTYILRALCGKTIKITPVVRPGREDQLEDFCNVDKIIVTTDLFGETAEWWQGHCEDIDIVIHGAWYVKHGEYLTAPQNLDCLIGSLNLAKGAQAAGVKKFVGLGTCLEYAPSAQPLSVHAPLNPSTRYGEAKAALYNGLKHWLPENDVDFAWCRLFNLFGQGEDKRRLVPYIENRIKNGEQVFLRSAHLVRDYLEVAKAGQMISEIAIGGQTGAINICSGRAISIGQLAIDIAEKQGRRDLLVFGDESTELNEPSYVVGVPNFFGDPS